ncbi:MLH1, partial [Symbiodinium sp. KB8]
AVEAVFSDYLPKGTHPWVYLRLDLPGDAVDVNVHPTKREVHFLGEDEVVEAVSSRVADVLMGANASRSFFAQTLLPGATAASQADPADGGTLSGRRLSAGHRNAQAPRQSLAAGDAVTVTLDHRGHAAAAGAAEAGSDLDQSDGDDSGVGAPAGKRRRGRAAGLREGNGRDGGASTPADGGGSERRGAGDGGDGRSHNDDGAGGHGDDGGGDDDEGGGDDSADDGEEEEEEEDAAAAKTRPRAARPTRSVVSKAAGYPSNTVRTDSGMQTLTRFLSVGGAGVLSDAVAAEGGQRGLAPAGSAGGGRLTSARSRAGRAAELRDFAMTAVDDCCDDGEGGAGAAEIDIDASCDVDGAPVAKRLRQAGGMDAASAVASAAGVGRAGAAAERTARRAGASPVRLTSVRELRAEAERATHKGLTAAVRKHTFVGVVDEELSLVQFGTKLLLVNHLSFARELMYQQALRLFAGMHSFELRPAPGVRELVLMALEGPDGRGMDEAAKGAAADAVASLLESKAEMLSEYFGFVLAMAYDVDWEDEKGCFQTVAAVLAELYARVPSIPRFTDEPFERPPASGGSRVEAATKALRAEDEELLKLRRQPGSALWVVEQVLWPAFRFGLTPSRALAEDHNVIQIACTEQLYRVFERC